MRTLSSIFFLPYRVRRGILPRTGPNRRLRLSSARLPCILLICTSCGRRSLAFFFVSRHLRRSKSLFAFAYLLYMSVMTSISISATIFCLASSIRAAACPGNAMLVFDLSNLRALNLTMEEEQEVRVRSPILQAIDS